MLAASSRSRYRSRNRRPQVSLAVVRQRCGSRSKCGDDLFSIVSSSAAACTSPTWQVVAIALSFVRSFLGRPVFRSSWRSNQASTFSFRHLAVLSSLVFFGAPAAWAKPSGGNCEELREIHTLQGIASLAAASAAAPRSRWPSGLALPS